MNASKTTTSLNDEDNDLFNSLMADCDVAPVETKKNKLKIPLIIEDDTEDEDDELPDEHFQCDRCKAIKHEDFYISISNDPSGNTICDTCIKDYVKERGIIEDSDDEDNVLPKAEVITTCKECGDDFENWLNTNICDICYDALSNDTDEDDEDDEDDILRCEKCGYEDYKNEDGEWTEVLTHAETDKVFCKDCMPKPKPKPIVQQPIKKMKVGKDKIMYYTGDENDMMNIRVIRFEAIKKQKPNEPCACGSGKKYKKCCNFV